MKPGDTVHVFRKGRDYGEGKPGEVVKVGRALVTIRWGAREDQFRIAGRGINDGYGETYFLTADEYALRAIGLGFGAARPAWANLTPEQVHALADVARTFPPLPGPPAELAAGGEARTYPVMEGTAP